MTAVVMTTVGMQRNSPRIWLEGRKLEREGFRPEVTYRLDDSRPDSLTLVAAADGDRVVSGRKRQAYRAPIIDIANKILYRWFKNGETVRIVIRRRRIKISVRRHRASEQVADRVRRLTTKLKNNQPLSIYSLFHGGGILDKALHSGLERAGIKSRVDVAVEMNSRYMDVSIDRHPELFSESTIFIEGKIQDVWLGDLPHADILVCGLPCTGASKAGRTKNKLAKAEDHPEAGALFYYFLDWVRRSNPGAVLLENVPELISTATMAAIRNVLESFGYIIQERIVSGTFFGSLEARKRLCMVAITEGMESGFDLASVEPIYRKPDRLGVALDDVPLDAEVWRTYSYLTAKEERDKADGKGFRMQIFTPDDSEIKTLTSRYHKGGSTDPLIAHPNDPQKRRKISRFEHARIKGIDVSYVEGPEITETLGHEVMGQGVTPGAFEAVAADLGKAFIASVQEEPEALVA